VKWLFERGVAVQTHVLFEPHFGSA
jgi:hypothetical protein